MPRFFRSQRITLFVIILVLSALARLLTFERFLPFMDYPDEQNMYMLALDRRAAPLGQEYGASMVADGLGSYPPLFVWGEMGIQSILDSTSNGRWVAPAKVIYWVRMLSVCFGILTTAFIFETARLMGGLRAGALAGLVWALAVPIVEFNSIAIPDPLVYMACAAALWGAAQAFYHQSFRWAAVGILAAVAAIYAKYTPVYALIPPLAAMIWLTLRRKPGAIRWWIATAVIGILSAGILIYVLASHPLNNNEALSVGDKGAQLLFSATRNWDNFQSMLAPVGVPALLLAVIAVLLVVPLRKKVRLDPFIGTLILYLLPIIPISALVNDTGGRAGAEIRHVMPGVIAIILLWSIGIAWVAHRWRGRSRPIAWAIAILSLMVWLVPTLAGDWNLVQRFQPPHVTYQLWMWSDESLPNDGLIMTPPNSGLAFTWNRPWSGYDGVTNFQWWQENIPAAAVPADYVKRGITYYTFNDSDRQKLDSPDFRAFVNQLQLIKTLPSPAPTAGTTIYVYRMMPPQYTSGVVLGDQIELVGYDLASAESGRDFTLRLYWRVLHPPDSNYSVFMHLRRQGDPQVIAQYDGAPTTPRSLTLDWTDPDELHLSSALTITAPDDDLGGSYVLRVGLYDFLSGVRLTTPEGQDGIDIPLN